MSDCIMYGMGLCSQKGFQQLKCYDVIDCPFIDRTKDVAALQAANDKLQDKLAIAESALWTIANFDYGTMTNILEYGEMVTGWANEALTEMDQPKKGKKKPFTKRYVLWESRTVRASELIRLYELPRNLCILMSYGFPEQYRLHGYRDEDLIHLHPIDLGDGYAEIAEYRRIAAELRATMEESNHV
ncbi:MAG: hypothetical protein ACYC3G_00705 [Minisyncoccota bacterium]